MATNLTVYEGTRGTDLVEEQIDERILRILGLEEVFDIDYSTYLSLLKEKAISSRMGGNELPTEETEVITEEFQRVRNKVGRFKIKTKKISAADIKGGMGIKPKQVLPGSFGSQSHEHIKNINEKLDDLLSSLRLENKETKEKAKEDRLSKERQKRQATETKLESGAKNTFQNIATKVLSPFKSIWSRLLKFVKFVALGFALTNISRWINNPVNTRKLKAVGKFLRDFWPVIGAGALLFLTPFGLFVKGLISTIAAATVGLTTFFVKHPWALALGLAAGGAAYLQNRTNRLREEQNKINDAGTVTPKEFQQGQVPSYSQLMNETVQQQGLGGSAGMFSRGGIISKLPTFKLPISSLNVGGSVITGNSGVDITGAGKDTQLIAGQVGETILQVGARERQIQMTGIDPLAFNVGPNANKPKMANNIQLAEGGGIVGGIMGMINMMRSNNETLPKWSPVKASGMYLIDPPNVVVRNRTIIMPPQSVNESENEIEYRDGTQIPKFSIIKTSVHRIRVLNELRIRDLVEA